MNSISLINQPPHFFSAFIVILFFMLSFFSRNERIKKIAHRVLYAGYFLITASGIYQFITLPFSLLVLIKSIGGLCLIVMIEMIVRGKGSAAIWTLLLSTAAVGLVIAYLFI